MATFLITGPDGKKYRVSGDSAEGAFQALQEHLGASQPSPPQAELSAHDPGLLGGIGNRLYDAAKALGLPASRMRRDAQALDAAVRGAADIPAFGLADEIAAGLGSLTGIGGQRGDYSGNLELQRAIDEQDAQQHPGARLAGQLVGGLALGSGLVRAGLSPTAGAIQAGWRVPGVAAAGGAEGLALGGLHGFGSGEGLEDRLGQAESGAKLGAMVGMAAPYAVAGAQRAITPFPANAERIAAAQALQREGVPLTAGQITGNRRLRYAEAELGGPKVANITERQAEAFTDAAMRRAGGAGRATPENLRDLNAALSREFDAISARNVIRADSQLVQDMNATMGEYLRVLPAEQRKIVQDIAQDIVDRFRAGQGALSGSDYQMIRSRLSRRAQNARGKDNELSEAFRGLRNALDSAMDRWINPQDAGRWAELRRQWGNKKVIERAAVGGGEDAAMGIVSPARLRMAASQGNQGAYARGQGDYSDLAHAGQAVMTPLPDSGTAGRMMARNLLPNTSTVGAILGGSPGTAMGDPTMAVAGALAGYAAPRLAGSALMSRPVQSYLSNQAMSQISPELKAWITALLTGQASAAAGRLPAP